MTRHGHATAPDPAEWPRYRRRLGRHVRDVRLEADVSLHDLAAKIGAHRSTLLRIENAEINVSLQTLFRIARGLGVSLQEVLP